MAAPSVVVHCHMSLHAFALKFIMVQYIVCSSVVDQIIKGHHHPNLQAATPLPFSVRSPLGDFQVFLCTDAYAHAYQSQLLFQERFFF